MSAAASRALWERLREHALVEGDMPQQSAASVPWYLRAMLGIAGWIGAVCLLAFVGITLSDVMRGTIVPLVIGLLCCTAAHAVFRAGKDNDFANQFGLALSMAGQGLFMLGIFNALKFGAAAGFLAIAVFEAALALLVPNFIHRMLTSTASTVALALAFARYGLHGIAPAIAAAGFALVWMAPQRWATRGMLWRPIGYGLALGLLLIEAIGRFGWREIVDPAGGFPVLAGYAPWIAAILTGSVLVWSVTRLLRNEGVAPGSRIGAGAIGAAVLAGMLSFWAQGAASALLIMLLGFACGNRTLLGLGIVGLLGFVSHYYYALHTTLLVKSAVLAASGVVLLAARLAMNKFMPRRMESQEEWEQKEEPGHA